MANPEHVDIVKYGAERIRQWRQEHPTEQFNLREADLVGVNLSGANLNGAKLCRANLSNAELRGATLIDANLSGANLRGAKVNEAFLHKADLSNTDLSGTSMTHTDLREANLSNAQFEGTRFSESDLRGAQLTDTNLREVALNHANLSTMQLQRRDLRKANLYKTVLHEADLSETNLREANLQEADLTRAVLKGANLYGTFLGSANLTAANLRQAILCEARLAEACLCEADMVGADLREADLTKANLTHLHGAERIHNLVTVRFNGADARYFDTCVRKRSERWLDWELIRTMGRLPLFGISYTTLGLILLLFYGLDFYNTKIDLLRLWAAHATSQPGHLLYSVGTLITDHLHRQPIPRQSFVLLMSIVFLAIASTMYTILCPLRIKEFSREQWCHQSGQSLLHYWPLAWKHRWARLICIGCYTLGGLGVFWVIIIKVCRVGWFIWRNSSFSWLWW